MPEEKLKIVQLFEEIQNGDRAAFNQLFFLYYDKLLSFARQYTKQQESAEEITSELFVRLWLKRDRLSKVVKPEVYLYVSIKNACLNLIRSERKRHLLFTKFPGDQSFEEPLDDNYVGTDDKELVRLMNQAIAALPEQRKIIFRLVKEQGLKSNAVAEILGISVRTVENQLYKAVKSLADSISGYLGYHPQGKTARKQAHSDLLFFFL
ncbi:RNA polymerase sigma-70 factor [Pedobacter steynii]|uniref:RNA polymerase sigma-70 factor n=1 Tax=Pedobacter steynii TaxID=430522 RepID=A0A1D7QES2_9SPHI|nr:RNA polymerase sigma-70 factor [Pedobacter steynii]AOM77099.1 RNA polymerase sigma-70 factor [Pedobacter steynii]